MKVELLARYVKDLTDEDKAFIKEELELFSNTVSNDDVDIEEKRYELIEALTDYEYRPLILDTDDIITVNSAGKNGDLFTVRLVEDLAFTFKGSYNKFKDFLIKEAEEDIKTFNYE